MPKGGRNIEVALILALAAGGSLVAQGPIDERIRGHVLDVPPLSERISVKPIEDAEGAFLGLKPAAITRIDGVVINELGVVLPAAGVVIIRSLQDGRLVAKTPVDSLGQFSIRGLDPGLYVAELVGLNETILAATPAFNLGIAQVVQLTAVVPHSSLGGLAYLVGNGTAGALNSAVSSGILAIEPGVPVSPQR